MNFRTNLPNIMFVSSFLYEFYFAIIENCTSLYNRENMVSNTKYIFFKKYLNSVMIVLSFNKFEMCMMNDYIYVDSMLFWPQDEHCMNRAISCI